jgi:hypothetical protein
MYTIYSVVIYLAGSTANTIGVFALPFAEVSIKLGHTSLSAQQQAITSAYNEILIGSLICWALIAPTFSLFTHALQNSKRRRLLYIAYAAIVAVYGFVFYIIFPQIAGAVNLAFSTGTYNSAPIRALLAQQQQLNLLAFIPAIIYAIAYYQIYQRIAKGEKSSLPPLNPCQLKAYPDSIEADELPLQIATIERARRTSTLRL